MKSSRKKIWLAVVVTALAIIACVCWATMMQGPTQIITLTDGRQYQFAGASWGTNHSQPRLLAHVVDHLPDKWADYVRTKLGPRVGLAPPVHGPSPTLVVWFELVRTNSARRFTSTLLGSAMLADGNGVRSGIGRSWYQQSPGWACAGFSEVPRRSRMLEFQTPDGSVKFRNPAFGRIPEWQPEPLPVEKSAGDLRVRLTTFASRFVPGGGGWYRDTVFSLAISSPRPDERWAASSYELSDATGNRLAGDPADVTSNGLYSIFGALWPDEPALRLKLGLKRVSGFSAAELITFTNLPVPRMGVFFVPINAIVLTNVVGGVTVEVMNFRNRGSDHADLEPQSLSAELPGNPPGLAVEIVEVATEKGEKWTGSPDAASSSSMFLWNIVSGNGGAKYLNVTVAVQKERFVEFLAKPAEEK